MVKEFTCSTSNPYFPRVRGTLLERFNSKIVADPNSGCWLWAGDSNGRYGSMSYRVNGRQHRILAHRFSYSTNVGPIPDGLELDHKCRTTFCVNPDHLEPVTPRENMLRIPKELLTTRKSHCPAGHEYSDLHWKRSPRRNPYRYCVKCHKAQRKRFMEKSDRPKRLHILIAVKRIVAERQNGICECGCGTPIWTEKKCNIEWDHSPALRLRDINKDGTDYEPPQLDPSYIVARCPRSHLLKTSGAGATTAGSDIGAIKKERKRLKALSEKPNRKREGKALCSRNQFQAQKGKSQWPKRKLPSRRTP